MRLWVALLLCGLAAGCVGSNKPYRPYKGEPRPDQEVREDPLVAEDAIKNGLPHHVLAHTTYIENGRKATRALLDTVYRNKDGSPRNAWKSYEDDVTAVLGPGTLPRTAPKPAEKPDRPVRKSEGEGEGEKKSDGEGEGDKPAGE